MVLETSAERLDLGRGQVPQQSFQRWRIDVEFLRSNCGVQRPCQGLAQGVEWDQATGRLRIDGGLLARGRPAWELAALGMHKFMRERAALLGPAQPDVEQDRSSRPPAHSSCRHHHQVHRPSGRDLPPRVVSHAGKCAGRGRQFPLSCEADQRRLLLGLDESIEFFR